MKAKLKLRNQRLVEDLHDLKTFLRENKDFQTKSQVVYDWLKKDYKDDEIAEKISNCKTREEMIYCINSKLEKNLAKKLRLMDNFAEESTPSRKIQNSFIKRVVVAQKREELISQIRETHQDVC